MDGSEFEKFYTRGVDRGDRSGGEAYPRFVISIPGGVLSFSGVRVLLKRS